MEQRVHRLLEKADEFAELADLVHVTLANNNVALSTHMRIGRSVIQRVNAVNSNDGIWLDIGLGIFVEFPLVEAKRYAELESKRLTERANALEQEFAQNLAMHRAAANVTL